MTVFAVLTFIIASCAPGIFTPSTPGSDGIQSEQDSQKPEVEVTLTNPEALQPTLPETVQVTVTNPEALQPPLPETVQVTVTNPEALQPTLPETVQVTVTNPEALQPTLPATVKVTLANPEALQTIGTNNVSKRTEKDQPIFWVSVFSALLIGAGLVVSAFVAWHENRQQYYIYLGQIWYDLFNTSSQPHNCQPPSYWDLYGQGSLTGYHTVAWKSWALAEDCYVTYMTGWSKGKKWLKWRERFKWANENRFKQFTGTIKSINEIHRPWLDLNMESFKPAEGFIDWLDTTHPKPKLKKVDKQSHGTVIHGEGIVAEAEIAANQLIGTFKGDLTKNRHNHTIQIGPDEHLDVSSDCNLRYINHSCTPNSIVRGISVYSLKVIKANEEITIDYNATEDTIHPAMECQELSCKTKKVMIPGWSGLSDEKKLKTRKIAHSWIIKNKTL